VNSVALPAFHNAECYAALAYAPEGIAILPPIAEARELARTSLECDCRHRRNVPRRTLKIYNISKVVAFSNESRSTLSMSEHLLTPVSEDFAA
jgi:hypothetical protein